MVLKIPVSVVAVSLLAACKPDGDVPPAPPSTPAPSASDTATPTPSPTPVANGARSVNEETDDYFFKYSYPAEAGNIPELSALLDKRLENTRTQLAEQSAQARRDARDNGFPYNRYSNNVEWKVVADIPGYLSLSANLSSYSGGAHGNYGFTAMVWDKEAGRAIDPKAMFIRGEALDEALGKRLCEALDKERAKRRGDMPEGNEADWMNECVPVDDTTVIVGSSNGKTFNRLGVLIGPYTAGPYAEGAYELDFPVDAAVLGAVKSEYREAFSAS